MAQSPREIQRRIRGIKSTQQITKAMEMVAAVKLNRVRMQAEHSRPYVDKMYTMMSALCTSSYDFSDPLFLERPASKVLLVVVSSDRGLCGTFNVNVINAAKNFIEEQAGNEVTLLTIGRKAHDSLVRLGNKVEKYYAVPWGEALSTELRSISTYLMEAFIAERYDRVYVLYSKFVNVLKFNPTLVQYLPIPPLTQAERKKYLRMCTDFLVEPDFESVANLLGPGYLETRLYQAVVESLASEYAARMVAMRNANDNADEVIGELSLTYNKARQATITRDLIDIIGGVNALKG
jgi:F-type H+-transporting ATPase subunit gamma